ncbi:unnamed protein product [Ectocarpus sp. 4 AP-2014]
MAFSELTRKTSSAGRTSSTGTSRERTALTSRGFWRSWTSSTYGRFPSKLTSNQGSGRSTSSPTSRGSICAPPFLASSPWHGIFLPTRILPRK